MDPIGIAGGANVYGFASGDPVNFSDPFGLAACTKEEVASGRETVANKGGSICVERRSRPTDAEAACSAAIAGGWLRAVADVTSVAEGGPALRMAGRALLSEVRIGFVGFFANARALGGAQAGKIARDAAKVTAAANYAYGNALGAAGASVVTDATRPREDNGSFSLGELIPLRNLGRDARNAYERCNGR